MIALTHSPADIVRQLLVDLGLAVDPAWMGARDVAVGWPAFAHTEPPQPDDCITVRETDPQDDGPDMHGNLYFHHGCQVRFRSSVQNDGQNKARAVQTFLFQPSNVQRRTVTLDSVNYEVWCVIPGGVLNLGMNVPTDKRFLVTLNIRVPIRVI